MTEEHARNLYRAFQTQGRKAECDTCHCVRTCIAHVADFTYECYNCCIQRLVREEEKQCECKRIPLNMEDFCK